MKIAIYPGSFDPITNGHLDVLKTASEIFDKVIITVCYNAAKKGFLSVEDRVKLIKGCTKDFPNVEVDSFDGLTVDYAKQKNSKVLIRGLRAVSDFEYEMQLSQTNSALQKDVKTIFLTTRPKYNFISSSSVKEIINLKGDVSKFVPANVNEFLIEKFC